MKYLCYTLLTFGLFGCSNSHQYPERTIPKHIPIKIEKSIAKENTNYSEALFWGINNCKEIKLRQTYIKNDSLWVHKFNYSFPTPINTNIQGIDLEGLLTKENSQVEWSIDTTTFEKSKILKTLDKIKAITKENDSLLFQMGSCTNRAIWIHYDKEREIKTTYNFSRYDENLVNLFLEAFEIKL